MPNWDPNSIVDFLKSTGQDSSRSNLTKLAQENGINNYSGTASQNTQLLQTLRSGQTPGTPNGGASLQGTLPPETPPAPPAPDYPTVPAGGAQDQGGGAPENRSLPANTPAVGSIAAFKDVMRNISRTAYDQGPQISDLLQQYSSGGVPLTDPNAINRVISRDTSSRSGAISDMYKGALESNDEMAKQRQKTLENLAPAIYDEFTKNPDVPYQQLVTKYAQQYGIDPLELAGKVITYKTDHDKENLLMEKANLDLLSSKINLLRDSGATGKVTIPGIGEIEIQKKGDFSTVTAGNSLFVFDKNTGQVTNTGMKVDQLDANNILSAITGLAKGDYANPGVVEQFLGDQGVKVPGTSSIQIPKSSYLAYTNNNPGNLRFVGQSGASKGNGGFAKFDSPEAGYQALIDDLNAKKAPGGSLDSNSTLTQLINVYAPPSENNTGQYIQQMATWMGVTPQTKIGQIPTEILAKAIAKKESSTVIGAPSKTTTVATANKNVSATGRAKDEKYQTAAGKLADDFTTASKDFITQRNAFQNAISTNVNTTNPQDDISLIFSFMKVVDPTSVVRESEFNTAAKASSLLDQFNIKVGKAVSGQILNPIVRQNIINTMKNRFKNAEENQKQVTNTYTTRAQQFQIDPTDVVTDYTKIKVRDKKSGKTGTLPLSEFNPTLYDKI